MEVNFAKDNGPVIDVETVATPTPVAGVVVESVNTAAAPAPVAPVVPTPVVDATPVAAIPTAPAAAPLAVAVAPTPGAVSHDPTKGLDEDNIGFEDVILPRINIVQKVGDLSNIFNGGEIVLNQTDVIHEPANDDKKTAGTGPLIITVLGFRRRQFTEKIAGGKLGMLLNHEEEISKNNGTLDYKEWKASIEAAKVPGAPAAKRYFQRLATALLLVQRPAGKTDDDHVLFPFECEGQYYALALWSMKGIGYTNGAKVIFTHKKIGHLRGGYTAQQYGLTSELKDYEGNWAYKPVLKPAAKNTDGFRAFCREVLGQ